MDNLIINHHNLIKNNLFKNIFIDLDNNNKDKLNSLHKIKNIVAIMAEISLHKNSFYYTYTKTLPSFDTFINHPIFVFYNNKNKFEILKEIDINSYNELLSSKIYIDDVFNILKNNNILNHEVFDNEKNIFDLFLYSFLLITTRSWGNGIIPFLDNFNHTQYSNISLSKDDKGSYLNYHSLENENNNEDFEIFVNYNINDTNKYFLFYNFIEEKNSIHINIDLHGEENEITKIIFNEVKKIQEQLKNNIYISDNFISKPLENISKIICLNYNELQSYLQSTDKNKYLENYKNEYSNEILKSLILNIILIKFDSQTMSKTNNFIKEYNNLNIKNKTVISDIIYNIALIKTNNLKVLKSI